MSKRLEKVIQERTSFPAKGGKLDALPQHIKPQRENAHLAYGQPRRLTPQVGKLDALPQLKKPVPENAGPSRARKLSNGRGKLPQINAKPQPADLAKSKGGKLDALPQHIKPHCENAHLAYGQPRRLTPQVGKLDALPQLKKPVPENAGPSRARKLSNGRDKLPQINAKPQPHIADKRQPSSYMTAHRHLNPETKPIDEDLPKCSVYKSPPYKQKHSQHLESYALPMAPKDALRHFGKRLNDFEQHEILGYSEIWYLGLKAKKIKETFGKAYNSSYDNKNGAFNPIIHDHIAYRYEVLGLIGQGSFGQVFKCLDHKTKERVAIKVIRNQPSCHQQGMVELRMLHALQRKDKDSSCNIINMKGFFYFRNHLCITFELLGPNLDKKLEKNGYHGFSQEKVRHIAQMLLKSLTRLKEKKIVHCDLKPGNIVMSRDGQGITVIDFGCSFFEDQKVRTSIGTQFYFSPEVILGQPSSSAIDMWSLGCILAELHTGLPLFPGEDEHDQIARIMEVLGLPPTEILQTSSRRHIFFDSEGTPKTKDRQPSSKKLENALKTNDALFLDFIAGCLTWDPTKRLNPEEALQHPWILGSTTNAGPESSL